jgi:hypothetical protein
VTRLDEFDFPFCAVEASEHAIDAVSGVSEYVPDAPLMQALDHEITYGLGHPENSLRSTMGRFKNR